MNPQNHIHERITSVLFGLSDKIKDRHDYQTIYNLFGINGMIESLKSIDELILWEDLLADSGTLDGIPEIFCDIIGYEFSALCEILLMMLSAEEITFDLSGLDTEFQCNLGWTEFEIYIACTFFANKVNFISGYDLVNITPEEILKKYMMKTFVIECECIDPSAFSFLSDFIDECETVFSDWKTVKVI